MSIQVSRGEKTFGVFNSMMMIFLIAITLYPFLYVLFASFSRPDLYMAHEGMLLKPLGFSLKSYEAVFKDPRVLTGYKNTLIVLVFGVGVNILMTILAAYFLSRKNVLWRNAVMMLIVFTMFFKGGLIPYYFVVRGLGLDNKLVALIIPKAVYATYIIILRTAFAGIPDSIEESAKMDGANHLTILFRIIVPLAFPTIAVLILYYGVRNWNAWFEAMIFLRDRTLYPLQLVLREILIVNDTEAMTMEAASGEHEMLGETIKYALIIVTTLPILALYPFLQKYFVKGVMIGSLKG
jgi:putative aldouronate transport system permease protein